MVAKFGIISPQQSSLYIKKKKSLSEIVITKQFLAEQRCFLDK